jgi:hypothetical protein
MRTVNHLIIKQAVKMKFTSFKMFGHIIVVIQLEINMLLFLLDRDGFGSSRGYKKI